jgi:predicted dehydrogenase
VTQKTSGLHSSDRGPVRVLQVGVGGFGKTWLAALAQIPEDVQYAGLCDQVPTALEEARALTGLDPGRCDTDLAAALAAADPEVAVVVVPPDAHRPVATQCLEAGVPVLLEKPLAGTREDCAALVEAARRSGLELAVSQNYRYRPVIETARQAIASGRLGTVAQAQVDFRIHHDFRGTFRESMDHPLILDMAVHHFDLLRFVCGLEPRHVYAESWNPPWSQFAGDASAVCVFAMDRGARVVYSASWHPRGQFTDWNCRWLVECEGGYLTLDRDRVRCYEGADPHRPGTPEDEVDVPLVELRRTDQAAVLLDFVTAIREGRPAPTTAEDNLRSLEMVFGAVDATGRAGGVALGGSVRHG